MKSTKRGMTSPREATDVLRSIILLRKVRPAGTTLAAKLRVPVQGEQFPLAAAGTGCPGVQRVVYILNFNGREAGLEGGRVNEYA